MSERQGWCWTQLRALAQPQPEWRVLHVVWGDDAATEGVVLPAGQLTTINVADLKFANHKPLPFADNTFDWLVCCFAAHHIALIDRFLAQGVRVLRPGGWLTIADIIVPGGRKKQAQAVDRYLNAWQKLRDPHHERCLSQSEWHQALYAAGLTLHHEETNRREYDFDDWLAEKEVFPANWIRLRAMLQKAPAGVQAVLTPQKRGDRISFYLPEGLFVAGLSDTTT